MPFSNNDYINNWFDKISFGSDIHITKEAETLLKEPFGTLFEGPESDHSIAIKKALDSISNESYESMRIKYVEFVSSEKNLKMIKSALEKKESLKPDQIEKLEKMLREAK